MLFYVGWKPRVGQGIEQGEAALEVFSRWKPPHGLDIKGMWGRPDGGGFCVCDASSAELVFEATAPWAGTLLDYDIVPIVDMQKAADLLRQASAFRRG